VGNKQAKTQAGSLSYFLLYSRHSVEAISIMYTTYTVCNVIDTLNTKTLKSCETCISLLSYKYYNVAPDIRTNSHHTHHQLDQDQVVVLLH